MAGQGLAQSHGSGAAGDAAAVAAPAPAPTLAQLMRFATIKGLPFVAFGLFDNMIMITAGEQIDAAFGAKLGLSSMAAAGLGAGPLPRKATCCMHARTRHASGVAPLQHH